MPKKIDYYIIRKFLGTFAFAIFLFTLIAVVIDLTEKIDNFIEDDVPLYNIIFDYYTNFIPHISALLTPLFIFIAVIFFTSRMASNLEIIAILSSGVSYYRMLVPYMVAAAILAFMLYYANHWLVPKANTERIQFENKYMMSINPTNERNIHLQIDTGTFIYMKTYDKEDSIGYKFSLEQFKNGRLISKLRAKRIKWNEKDKNWTIKQYHKRKFHRGSEELIKGDEKLLDIDIQPKDLSGHSRLKEAMPTNQLNKLIKQKKQRGSKGIVLLEVEKYRRTADAFTIFILTIVGVSIASRKARGGIGLHIVLGLIIAAGFIVFGRFFTTFSTNGNLDPILGVWIPNMIFTAMAVVLVRFAPK